MHSSHHSSELAETIKPLQGVKDEVDCAPAQSVIVLQNESTVARYKSATLYTP